jgi:hypothetical protein
VERRLGSIGKDLYVMLVILLYYMLTSSKDSAASAVYSSSRAAFVLVSIRSMPLIIGGLLD